MCENRSCINRVQRFPGADASNGKLYLTVEIQAFEHSNTLPRFEVKIHSVIRCQVTEINGCLLSCLCNEASYLELASSVFIEST